MKVLARVFLISILFVSSAFAATSTNILEGKTFKGEVVAAEKGAKPDPDTFIFKDGQFHSTACDQYGYGTAPFTVHEKKGKTVFNTMTKNKNGATIKWHGQVEGDKISGTAVMTTGKGKKTNMTFQAKLEGAAATKKN